MRTGCVSAIVAAGLLAAGPALAAAPPSPVPPPLDIHRAPSPPASYSFHTPAPYPTASWALLQLLPSPELAFGRQRTIGIDGTIDGGVTPAFGVRWQLSPLVWSFGVHRRQSPWRAFVVDPVARQSGSLELSQTFEYVGGHIGRMLVRPGVRVYLPVMHRGEYVSTSLGTSIYQFDGDLRVAYDVGIYFLSGLFGFQATVAPTHDPLAAIATLRLRYF